MRTRLLVCALAALTIEAFEDLKMRIDPREMPEGIRTFARVLAEHHLRLYLRGSRARQLAAVELRSPLRRLSAARVGSDWDLAYIGARMPPRDVLRRFGVVPEPAPIPRFHGTIDGASIDLVRLGGSYYRISAAPDRPDLAESDAVMLRTLIESGSNLTLNSFHIDLLTGAVWSADGAENDLLTGAFRTAGDAADSLRADPTRIVRDLRDIARLGAYWARPTVDTGLRDALLNWRSCVSPHWIPRLGERSDSELSDLTITEENVLRDARLWAAYVDMRILGKTSMVDLLRHLDSDDLASTVRRALILAEHRLRRADPSSEEQR
jgi:hypothetical protein